MAKGIRFYVATLVIAAITSSRTDAADPASDPARIKGTHQWRYVKKEHVLSDTGSIVLLEELVNSIDENGKYRIQPEDDNEYDYDYIKDNQFRSAVEVRLLKYICLLSDYAYSLRGDKKYGKAARSDFFFAMEDVQKILHTCRQTYGWSESTSVESEVKISLDKVNLFRYNKIIEYFKNRFVKILTNVPVFRADTNGDGSDESQNEHSKSSENKKIALHNVWGPIRAFVRSFKKSKTNIDDEIKQKRVLYESLTRPDIDVFYVFNKDAQVDLVFEHLKTLSDIMLHEFWKNFISNRDPITFY